MSFKDEKKSIQDGIKEGTISSKSSNKVFAQLTKAYLNDPMEESVYTSKDGKPFEDKVNVVDDFRKQVIGKVVKSAGLDASESMDFAMKYQFDNSQAEAIGNLSKMTAKHYIETGKTLTLPMTSKEESAINIAFKQFGEKQTPIRAIKKHEDGSFESTLTGQVSVTSQRYGAKVSNKTPDWLKKIK